MSNGINDYFTIRAFSIFLEIQLVVPPMAGNLSNLFKAEILLKKAQVYVLALNG
jgi:hypothetical protein